MTVDMHEKAAQSAVTSCNVLLAIGLSLIWLLRLVT